MNTVARKPTLRLLDYYLIEGMSSFAATIFLLGIYFWARARFDYTNTENLALGAVQGLAHTLASRYGGRLGDRWGYNRTLLTGLSIVCIITLGGWLGEARWIPFATVILYASAIALTWPAIEGGAMHLPGSINMPQRLGIYNLVWSFCGSAGFILCGFMFAWNINTVFWLPAILHAAQILWIITQRGRHQISGETAMSFPHQGDHQSPALKRELTLMAWLSNSLGYFLAGGFAALTPHLGEKFGLPPAWSIWLGSTLLASRALGFTILYNWNGWHYRRGWSHLALWSAPFLLALIFFANHLAVVAAACLLLGFSLGLSYYQSIYYSLDASDNKGEQGGLHEAIIGIGILAGPLVGTTGGHITGSTFGAKIAIIVCACFIGFIGYNLIRRRRSDR